MVRSHLVGADGVVAHTNHGSVSDHPGCGAKVGFAEIFLPPQPPLLTRRGMRHYRRLARLLSRDYFSVFGLFAVTLPGMTGGQLIVECLVRHGVDVVFGIPGAHTVSIYDALYRHAKIKHILVRHEQSAALMADGYARSTGKPGVCCVTTGPGVTNAATGLAVAHSDSIPVLLVSSNVHSGAAQKWRGLFH